MIEFDRDYVSFQKISEFNLPVQLKSNVELIAFSDAHGEYHLAKQGLYFIGKEPKLKKERIIVNLGDNINRGPDSGKIVARGLFSNDGDLYQDANANKVVELMGNHEQMMATALRFVHTGDHASKSMSVSNHHLDRLQALAFRIWSKNSGLKTLKSIKKEAAQTGFKSQWKMQLELWINTLKSNYIHENLLFVHAGLHPDLNLQENLDQPFFFGESNLSAQTLGTHMDQNKHWAWIRDPFLNEEDQIKNHGFFIMHGHSSIDPKKNTPELIASGRFNHDTNTTKSGSMKFTRVYDQTLEIFMAKYYQI